MIYMRVFNIAINEVASYVYANAHLVTCPKKNIFRFIPHFGSDICFHSMTSC